MGKCESRRFLTFRTTEAFDLLQALNTRHLGSLSTIHANSAEQALTRLAHCVLTANVGLPLRSIREAIADAIHVVVHLARVNGHRRVIEITEVGSYDASSERFVLSSRMPQQPVVVEKPAGWRDPLRDTNELSTPTDGVM